MFAPARTTSGVLGVHAFWVCASFLGVLRVTGPSSCGWSARSRMYSVTHTVSPAKVVTRFAGGAAADRCVHQLRELRRRSAGQLRAAGRPVNSHLHAQETGTRPRHRAPVNLDLPSWCMLLASLGQLAALVITPF